MDAFIIEGPTKLNGSVLIHGSKNTALPLLFSSLLFDEEMVFENIPRLWDIETTLGLLGVMGAQSQWNREQGSIRLWPKVLSKVAPYDWVKRMRAGILALGPLLAKYGEAKVSLPGGCAIGARPVNFHLEAMEKMGVSVTVENGYVKAQVLSRVKGAEIQFPMPTVTGTENLLMLASLAEGTTVLRNAALEPEVVALGEFLKSSGCPIEGLGTSEIIIQGVNRLKAPPVIRVPPDRIETGTWIAAALATRSELTLRNCDPSECRAVMDAFSSMGAQFRVGENTLEITPPSVLKPIELETAPYPGFPTDMQAQMLVVACLADGKSRFKEKIFENRFMHVAELRRLGAKISIRSDSATVRGPVTFMGAPIMATDLRASASLVIAALCAKGQTKISRIYHLDRGYQRLDETLGSLGACVRRVSEA